MFPDWGNNIITIQGTGIIKTIPITKKVGTPTKQPKVLVCYDFHFGISDEEKDLMFAIYSKLFSIGTIVVPTLVKLEQLVNLIPSIGLNLVEHVFILVQLIKINLGYEKNLQQVRINIDLKLVVNSQLVELLKEFKDIFAWTYKDLKGIPLEMV